MEQNHHLKMDGVIIKKLSQHSDLRGFLIETYRADNIEIPTPQMSYISATFAGFARGPHEHKHQTDVFCFLGTSRFKVRLWDNRPESKTYQVDMEFYSELEEPLLVIVPPGVVHGYKNIGHELGYVINLPDKLYAGWDKESEVDEIRWENKEDSPFKI